MSDRDTGDCQNIRGVEEASDRSDGCVKVGFKRFTDDAPFGLVLGSIQSGLLVVQWGEGGFF